LDDLSYGSVRKNNKIAAATGGKLRGKSTSKPADISNLKKIISEEFPDSTLCKVLRVESDYLSSEEFLIKLTTWLKLSKEGGK
jgi:hypothetical protein